MRFLMKNATYWDNLFRGSYRYPVESHLKYYQGSIVNFAESWLDKISNDVVGSPNI